MQGRLVRVLGWKECCNSITNKLVKSSTSWGNRRSFECAWKNIMGPKGRKLFWDIANIFIIIWFEMMLMNVKCHSVYAQLFNLIYKLFIKKNIYKYLVWRDEGGCNYFSPIKITQNGWLQFKISKWLAHIQPIFYICFT